MLLRPGTHSEFLKTRAPAPSQSWAAIEAHPAVHVWSKCVGKGAMHARVGHVAEPALNVHNPVTFVFFFGGGAWASRSLGGGKINTWRRPCSTRAGAS